jgi:HSP20 family protein
MDRLFPEFFEDGLWAPRWGLATETAYPAINIWEDDAGFHVEAELPGYRLEDLEILVEGQNLTLKGERQAAPVEGVTCHRRERNGAAFSRVVRLPLDVEAGKVEATLKDGILMVHLPKAESAKVRKIPVLTK